MFDDSNYTERLRIDLFPTRSCIFLEGLLGSVVQGVHPQCSLFTDEIILSGWSDGKIRAFRVDNNQQLWQIDNAHKNGVTAIALSHNNKFIVSGGQEGEVRVWEIRSRELISHLKEHTSKVTKV